MPIHWGFYSSPPFAVHYGKSMYLASVDNVNTFVNFPFLTVNFNSV